MHCTHSAYCLLPGWNQTASNKLEFPLSRVSDEDVKTHICAQLSNEAAKIESVDLSGNAITAVGASELARAIRSCPTLTALSVAGNRIRDEGAGLAALSQTAAFVAFSCAVLHLTRSFNLLLSALSCPYFMLACRCACASSRESPCPDASVAEHVRNRTTRSSSTRPAAGGESSILFCSRLPESHSVSG